MIEHFVTPLEAVSLSAESKAKLEAALVEAFILLIEQSLAGGDDKALVDRPEVWISGRRNWS